MARFNKGIKETYQTLPFHIEAFTLKNIENIEAKESCFLKDYHYAGNVGNEIWLCTERYEALK